LPVSLFGYCRKLYAWREFGHNIETEREAALGNNVFLIFVFRKDYLKTKE